MRPRRMLRSCLAKTTTFGAFPPRSFFVVLTDGVLQGQCQRFPMISSSAGGARKLRPPAPASGENIPMLRQWLAAARRERDHAEAIAGVEGRENAVPTRNRGPWALPSHHPVRPSVKIVGLHCVASVLVLGARCWCFGLSVRPQQLCRLECWCSGEFVKATSQSNSPTLYLTNSQTQRAKQRTAAARHGETRSDWRGPILDGGAGGTGSVPAIGVPTGRARRTEVQPRT